MQCTALSVASMYSTCTIHVHMYNTITCAHVLYVLYNTECCAKRGKADFQDFLFLSVPRPKLGPSLGRGTDSHDSSASFFSSFLLPQEFEDDICM